MALQDFAPAAEMHGHAEESDLDEDLFNFPLTASLEEVGDREGETEPELKEPVSRPVAESAPAPAEPRAISDVDADPDEDLFRFNPPELPADVSPERTGTTLEQGLDRAAASISDLLEDDLGEMVEETHQEQLAAQRPAPAPVAQPAVQGTAQVAARSTPGSLPEVAPMAPPVRPLAVPANDPRIMWVLTGAVIVFMLGLLTVAWQATSNIGQAMSEISEAASETAADTGPPDGTATVEQLAILQEILRQQKLATQAALGATIAEGPPPMLQPHEITLAVAQESIDGGRFSETRRELYGMLATAEQLPAEGRDQAEETAAYLLARSYRLEAGTDPGEER